MAATYESNSAGQDENASDESGIVLGVLLAVLLLPVSSGHGQIVHGGVGTMSTVVSGTRQSAS